MSIDHETRDEEDVENGAAINYVFDQNKVSFGSQFAYGSGERWMHTPLLCRYFMRRDASLRFVAFAAAQDTEKLREHIRDWNWWTVDPNEGKYFDETSVAITVDGGMLLYPGTFLQLCKAAEFVYDHRGSGLPSSSQSWCRLVPDADFHARLTNPPYETETIYREVHSTWFLDIRTRIGYVNFQLREKDALSLFEIHAAIAYATTEII